MDSLCDSLKATPVERYAMALEEQVNALTAQVHTLTKQVSTMSDIIADLAERSVSMPRFELRGSIVARRFFGTIIAESVSPDHLLKWLAKLIPGLKFVTLDVGDVFNLKYINFVVETQMAFLLSNALNPLLDDKNVFKELLTMVVTNLDRRADYECNLSDLMKSQIKNNSFNIPDGRAVQHRRSADNNGFTRVFLPPHIPETHIIAQRIEFLA